jgi:hypothetical protein
MQKSNSIVEQAVPVAIWPEVCHVRRPLHANHQPDLCTRVVAESLDR